MFLTTYKHRPPAPLPESQRTHHIHPFLILFFSPIVRNIWILSLSVFPFLTFNLIRVSTASVRLYRGALGLSRGARVLEDDTRNPYYASLLRPRPHSPPRARAQDLLFISPHFTSFSPDFIVFLVPVPVVLLSYFCLPTYLPSYRSTSPYFAVPRPV